MITATIALLAVFVVLSLVLLLAKDDPLHCSGECQQGRLPCPAHCPRNQPPKEKT